MAEFQDKRPRNDYPSARDSYSRSSNHREDRRYRSRSRERDDRRNDRSSHRDKDYREGSGRNSGREQRSRDQRDIYDDRDGRNGQDSFSRRDDREVGRDKRGGGRDGGDRQKREDTRREQYRNRSRSRSPKPESSRGDKAGRSGGRPTSPVRRYSPPPAAPVKFVVGPEKKRDAMDVDKPRSSTEQQDYDARDEEEGEFEVEDDSMLEMQRMMGFGGFGTTQNKKVEGNDVGYIRKEKKTEYRQYMNRVGGFNRPLSPSR